MKKRLFSIFAAIFVLMQCTLLAGAVGEIQEEKSDIPTEEYYLAQSKSIQLYNELLDGFKPQACTTNLTEGLPYPDNYGGAYIDLETGELIILLTDMDDMAIPFNSNSDGYSYEKCSVSMNEINEAIAMITENLERFHQKGIDIIAVYDDILNQCVVVEVRDLTAEKEKEILEIGKYPFVKCKEASSISRHSEIGGGWPATNATQGGSGTIGFPAKRNGVVGFVTAGHGADGTGASFVSTSPYTNITTNVGTVTHNAFYDGSSADALFIRAASGTTTTTELYFGERLDSASTQALPVNTQVYKYGSATELTSGYITATNLVLADGKRTTGCCLASYESAPGDSGGPILVYHGYVAGERLYVLYGIHIAGNGLQGVYTPYGNIVNELGATFYRN